jgi:hypothetical protein
MSALEGTIVFGSRRAIGTCLLGKDAMKLQTLTRFLTQIPLIKRIDFEGGSSV